MDSLIAEATKRFDVVLIDTPPILGVSDSSLLVNRADVTLFVLQPRKMPLGTLVRAKKVVMDAGGRLMGLVLNNVDINSDSQYQYYTTYYSYYAQENRGDDTVASSKKKSTVKNTKPKLEETTVTPSDSDIY